MSVFSSRLKGRSIIASGTIVGRKDDLIEIFPFAQAPTYCIKPIFVPIEMTFEPAVRAYQENTHTVALEIKQPWSFPNESSIIETIIASDADNQYFLNCYIKFVGEAHNFSFNFNYTITSGTL